MKVTSRTRKLKSGNKRYYTFREDSLSYNQLRNKIDAWAKNEPDLKGRMFLSTSGGSGNVTGYFK